MGSRSANEPAIDLGRAGIGRLRCQPAAVTALRDAQELCDKPAPRPVRPYATNNNPSLVWREWPKHDAVDFGAASASGTRRCQRRLVPASAPSDSARVGDNPHAHVQRIEQIKSMPAATRPALGMSDNDVLACEIRRLTTSSMSKRMGFREAPPATLRTTRDR